MTSLLVAIIGVAILAVVGLVAARRERAAKRVSDRTET